MNRMMVAVFFKKLALSPLFHFLMIGFGIFILYTAIKQENHNKSPTELIQITSSQVDYLINGFTRTWHRPPAQEELRNLINDYVREEVFYRQAKKMHLDENDTIVRRRMQQKIEFLAEEIISGATDPSEQDLLDYYHNHKHQYENEARFAFEQLFFSDSDHTTSGKNKALNALHLIQAKNIPVSKVNSEPTSLPLETTLTPRSKINDLFGNDFGNQLEKSSTDQWYGPIQSAYGWHIVYIKEKRPVNLPEYKSIKHLIERDYRIYLQKESINKLYNQLLGQYRVVISPRDKM